MPLQPAQPGRLLRHEQPVPGAVHQDRDQQLRRPRHPGGGAPGQCPAHPHPGPAHTSLHQPRLTGDQGSGARVPLPRREQAALQERDVSVGNK